MDRAGPVTVREALGVLRRWQARVLGGEAGLDLAVTWCTAMRARLPAFDHLQTGEVALLSLSMLRSLRARVTTLTLPAVVRQLAEMRVAAIAVGDVRDDTPLAPDDARGLDEARSIAGELGLPLIALATSQLGEVEHELISYLVARRERHAGAAEPTAVDAARLRESLRVEALDALLTGTYASEAAMRARAIQLGHDLARPHAVLWVDLAPHAPADTAAISVAQPLPAAAHVADELTTALGAWARPSEAQIAALLPLGPDDAALANCRDATERLLGRALGPARWAAGLGDRATSAAQVRRSAEEARGAARLGLLVLGAQRIARSADLGVYRLLLALHTDGTLAPFVDQTLAPLLADARYGDTLVETLDAFFACNGNVSQASERLHLHRNSLIYRLNRARELLGRDLDDPELRLALQLAIRGRRVIEAERLG